MRKPFRYIILIALLVLLAFSLQQSDDIMPASDDEAASTSLAAHSMMETQAVQEARGTSKNESATTASASPFRIERMTNNECVVHFALPAWQCTAQSDDAVRSWQTITADGASALAVNGAPSLPAYSFALAVPSNATVSIELEEIASTTLEQCVPTPGTAPQLSNASRTAHRAPDARYYDANAAPFPANNLAQSEDFCIRQLHGRVITFTPFRYIPSANAVEVTTSARIALRFDNASENTAELDANDAFAQLQRDFFLNGNTLRQASTGTSATETIGELVIVLPEAWAKLPIVEEFTTWKRKLGWKLTTLTVGTASIKNTAEALKTALTRQYNATQFTHLLILGDYSQVEPYQHINCDAQGNSALDLGEMGRVKSMYLRVGSDTPYVFLDGTDDIIFADAFISRLPVSSDDELIAALIRLIALERGSLTETEWQQHAVYISDAEASVAQPFDGQSDNELVDAMRETLYPLYPAANTTALYASATRTPTASEVVDALEQGCALSIYLGHGNCQAYSTTHFSASDAAMLDNAKHLPWLVAPVCRTGNLDHGSKRDVYCDRDSLGSKCLTAQLFTPTASDAGAAAVISATDVTFWDPPIIMLQSFAQQLSAGQYRTSGELFSAPLNASLQYCISYYDTYGEYGYTSSYATLQAWENYLAGDCSAVPRLTPCGAGFIRCSAQDANTLAVAVWKADATPAPGAIVALEANGNCYSAYADANGIAELAVNPQTLDAQAVIRVIHPQIAFIEAQLHLQDATSQPVLSGVSSTWQRYSPGVIHCFDSQGMLFLHDKHNRTYVIAPTGAILYPDEKYWQWRTAE